MHTKDMLAEALRTVGLTKMADKAATGYYHDFLSPLDTPALQLLNDLERAAEKAPNRDEILTVRDRAIGGDFDASDEEGEAWANSPDGQFAMRQLMRKP